MSDIKNLVELNDLISSGNSLQNDLTEAIEIIKKMFRQKYISKLENELKIQKQDHLKNPSKEIQLIQAVKPFMKQSKHKDIDSLTDTLVNISTLMDIQKKFERNSKKTENPATKVAAMNTVITKKDDSSIKEDGIYDIDEKCLLSKQSLNKNSSPNILVYILFIVILFNMK